MGRRVEPYGDVFTELPYKDRANPGRTAPLGKRRLPEAAL